MIKGDVLLNQEAKTCNINSRSRSRSRSVIFSKDAFGFLKFLQLMKFNQMSWWRSVKDIKRILAWQFSKLVFMALIFFFGFLTKTSTAFNNGGAFPFGYAPIDKMICFQRWLFGIWPKLQLAQRWTSDFHWRSKAVSVCSFLHFSKVL